MELRGWKLQMHSHDRCSADDLYSRVVRGHACHFAPFILLSKVTKDKHLCSQLFDIFQRKDGEARAKIPSKMVIIKQI